MPDWSVTDVGLSAASAESAAGDSSALTSGVKEVDPTVRITCMLRCVEANKKPRPGHEQGSASSQSDDPLVLQSGEHSSCHRTTTPRPMTLPILSCIPGSLNAFALKLKRTSSPLSAPQVLS